MTLLTFSQLKTKLQNDMDLINEPFIQDEELVGYMNEAIKDAQTAIHNLGIEGGYFLTPACLNLVSNQQAYSLPSDIYANKIMGMFFQNPPPSTVLAGTTLFGSAILVMSSVTGLARGQFVSGTGVPLFARIISISGLNVTLSAVATFSGSTSITFVTMQPILGSQQYPIKKIRNIYETMGFYPGDDYRYLIVNSQLEAGGNQLIFYPLPVVTGPVIMLWYIREVRALTTSTTNANNVLEIAECENFLYAHCKMNIVLKGTKRDLEVRVAAAKQQYDLMCDTLREMIPDSDNKVQLDMSAYYNQEVELHY